MGELILVALFGVVPALVGWRALVWYSSPDQVLKRAARKLPVTRIEDIVAGRQVKVVASLEMVEAPLEAPISGRKCAGWIVQLLEETDDDHKPILKDGALSDFALRSATGALAMVKVAYPSVTVRERVVFEIDREATSGRFFGGDPSERLARFLSKHGLAADKSYRYCEGVLEAGEKITVVGVADREPDPKGTSSYREMALTRVVFHREPIWIIDGPAHWKLL